VDLGLASDAVTHTLAGSFALLDANRTLDSHGHNRDTQLKLRNVDTAAGWTSAEVLRNGDMCDVDWGVTVTPAPASGVIKPNPVSWGLAFGRPRRVAGKVRQSDLLAIV